MKLEVRHPLPDFVKKETMEKEKEKTAFDKRRA
jgi:hypothetical protein